MPKTIVQRVVFKNAKTGDLYDLYMNPKKHAHISGGPVKVSGRVGAKFSAFGGYITGRNLHLVKNRLIVQSWRGSDWKKSDLDSTFVIHLEQKGKDVILLATHANVPDKHVPGITKGWHKHYWNQWKRHLTGKERTHISGM
ncbi:MAG TPA: SRPBCC domain-containing protein [Bacteroidota bacterium]